MNTYKPLGSAILVQLVFQKISDVIEVAEENEDVDKFATVLAVGDNVEFIKVNDEILVPQMKDGRELFKDGNKTYAVFKESVVLVTRKSI